MLPDGGHAASPARRRPGWGRWLLAAAVLLHVSVVSSALWRPQGLVLRPLFHDGVHRVGPGADFYALVHAAVHVRSGISPYDNTPDPRTPYFFPFRYLPAIAYLAVPLTWLPPHLAYLAWILTLEALLATALLVLRRRSRDERSWLIAAAALLLSTPYFLELHMGQFTFAAVALTLVSLYAVAGTALYALAVVLKIFPIAAAPALLLERRTRWFVPLALAAAALLSLPYFAGHPGDARAFLNTNFRPAHGYGAGNFSLAYLGLLAARSVGAEALTAHWGAWTSLSRALILGAVVLLIALARRRDVLVGVVTLLLAHFVTYQQVWEHHMSAVILAGGFLLQSDSLRGAARGMAIAGLILICLPTPYAIFDRAADPSVWDPAVHWPASTSMWIILPKAVGLLLLFAASIGSLRSAGQIAPRSLLSGSTWRRAFRPGAGGLGT